MNIGFYRELEKYFIQTEEKNITKDITNINHFDLGVIKIKTPYKNFGLPLIFTKDKNSIDNAAIVKFTSDEICICFSNELLEKCLNEDNLDIMYAICAHEIGHYLSGHFNNDINNNFLNIKTEEQKFLFSEYKRLQTNSSYTLYMRNVLTSLLRGGCTIKELEADLKALNFITFDNLISMHIKLLHKDNIFTRIEKLNRIKYLEKYISENKIDIEDYELDIEFNKPN